MRAVFVDTSVLHAALDRRDEQHDRVVQTWGMLTEEGVPLVATDYVITDTVALCQARLGIQAVRDLAERIVPLLQVDWIGRGDNDLAMAGLLAAIRRDLSLVDCVSFTTMRRLGIARAFTLDPHFREQGFECVPEAA